MRRPIGTLLLVLALVPANASAPARVAGAVGGGLVGAAAGLGVGLGIVVYRARFHEHYIESTKGLLSGPALPIPLGLAAGAAVGWAAPPLLAAGGVGALGGAAAGALVGWPAGEFLSDEPGDRWAGAVMGAAVGILLGVAVALLTAVRRRRQRSGRGREGTHARAAGLFWLVGSGALLACGGDVPPLPDVPPAPPVEADAVESVVFIIGDPGKARYHHFPILPRLAEDVERWAHALERDSSVVVLVLGDMVYPDGMHDPGTEGFWADSARVADQIDAVRGELAERRGALMYFVAGNHDWGLKEDRAGARRLRNLDRFLDRVRARGPLVDLVPEAGTGMPFVVDIGQLRLVLLDTAWWIFDAQPERKADMIERVARAIATAGPREVVIAAHHPYESAGPHGGFVPVWKTLGVRTLLTRSGAMLQDLDSRPYRALNLALGEVFAEVGRPLVFAGGHEHSLQVIRHDSVSAPRYSLVSGSASKLTGVGHVPGMLFRRSAPGYIRLVTRESGAVDVFVEAAPGRYLACPENEPAELEWERCMAEGVEAYETVFSMRLKDAPAVTDASGTRD